MNKKMVIKLLAKNTNLPKQNVERVLNGFENLILDALRKGEIVNFSGFFKLFTRQKNERAFVNFQTGESFIAPPKTVPAIKFSPNFIKKL